MILKLLKKENSPVDKNGLIKENIVGGGSSVQPDWNQNDSTQPDYVKNRPFYMGDPVKTVLVEEQTVAFSLNGDLYVSDYLQATSDFVKGQTYKIYFDRTAYECVCKSIQGNLVLGNTYLSGSGDNTGEPFIIPIQGSCYFAIGTLNTGSEHTVSITNSDSPIVKIDAKYLPDDPCIIIKKSTSGEYSCNMTFDEIANLHKKYGYTSELYDIRYNIFYYDGEKQYRCVNAWFSIDKFFGFEFDIDRNKYSYIGIGKSRVWYFEKYNPLTIIPSSTPGSTKKFEITVDDSGTITATEVT